MSKKYKVTVVGSGYVGMSLAVLLAQQNEVIVLDIDSERVQKINQKQSTIADPEIEKFLAKKELNLEATLDKELAYKNSDFIIISAPTNYDEKTNRFDTSSVDSVVKESTGFNKKALVVNTGKALEFLTKGKFKATNHRVLWNKNKRMSIPFFFEPSYDFKMDKSFLNGSKINNSGLIYEKFINHSLKKFVEYQR